MCQPETHDRLYADAAARRASRDFHEDPVKSGTVPLPAGYWSCRFTFRNEGRYRSQEGSTALDARLARARPPSQPKPSVDYDEDEAGRVPFEPKFTTRGPVHDRAPLHVSRTAAAQLRAREIAEARRRRSRSHVNDRSKAYLHNARRNAYADLWRDVVALDRLATNETAPVDSALALWFALKDRPGAPRQDAAGAGRPWNEVPCVEIKQ